MSPRVQPRLTNDELSQVNDLRRKALHKGARPTRPLQPRTRSSFAEYRTVRDHVLERMPFEEGRHSAIRSAVDERAFWRYATATMAVSGDPLALLDKLEHRALSKATSAAGGYLVPTDFDNLVTTLRRARSVISAVAREIETDHGRTLLLPTATTHGTSSWQPENASAAAPSDEVFGQASLGAFKANTSVVVSEELDADALPAFDEFLAAELAGRQAVLEETALAVGDGSGKPLGIAHSTSGYSVVTAATGSSLVFKAADVAAAYAALGAGYLPRSSWLMGRTAFQSLAGLADTAGALVFPTLHNAQPTLYASPVYMVPDLPVSAASARSVVFGDISAAYTVRRVSGLGLHRLQELYSENGQVGWRLYWRLDGRPVDLAAAIILRHSAT